MPGENMGKTKRKEQSQATRERIRNTAVQLMKEHSIDEISVTDICEKAEVGVGTFYYYYKTKDNIILEVFEELDIRFADLYESKAAETMTAYQYVLEHCLCYARFISETGVEFTSKVYSLQSSKFVDTNRSIYRLLRLFLEKKQTENLMDEKFDIQEFCHLIAVCIRGMGFDWCLHDGDYDLLAATADFIEIFLVKYKKQLMA